MAKNLVWADEEYLHLDAGIRELVKALHFLGVKTVMSCQGHIRTSCVYQGILPWPWIIIAANPRQMEALQKSLDSWNNANWRKKWILSVERIHGSFTPDYVEHMIEREFRGCQVRALVPREENNSLSHEILAELQTHVPDLSRFLLGKEKHFENL